METLQRSEMFETFTDESHLCICDSFTAREKNKQFVLNFFQLLSKIKFDVLQRSAIFETSTED